MSQILFNPLGKPEPPKEPLAIQYAKKMISAQVNTYLEGIKETVPHMETACTLIAHPLSKRPGDSIVLEQVFQVAWNSQPQESRLGKTQIERELGAGINFKKDILGRGWFFRVVVDYRDLDKVIREAQETRSSET